VKVDGGAEDDASTPIASREGCVQGPKDRDLLIGFRCTYHDNVAVSQCSTTLGAEGRSCTGRLDMRLIRKAKSETVVFLVKRHIWIAPWGNFRHLLIRIFPSRTELPAIRFVQLFEMSFLTACRDADFGNIGRKQMSVSCPNPEEESLSFTPVLRVKDGHAGHVFDRPISEKYLTKGRRYFWLPL